MHTQLGNEKNYYCSKDKTFAPYTDVVLLHKILVLMISIWLCRTGGF